MSNSFLIVLTIVVLKYCIFFTWDTFLWIHYCQTDIKFCQQCFQHHSNPEQFVKYLSISNEFGADFNIIFGRKIQKATLSIDSKIQNVILKYNSNDEILTNLKYSACTYIANKRNLTLNATNCDNNEMWHFDLHSNELSEILNHLFKMRSNFISFTVCPTITNDFMRTFNHFKINATFWMQLSMNPELIVLNAIQNSRNAILKNSVPNVLDWCGFVILEEDTGDSTLLDFYNYPFRQRIFLAQQILNIAIAFSYGLNDRFRIYFTDATPDNIVVNKFTLRLTFVDLDSLLIVDSQTTQKNIVNRHEQIDCEHCFAFIPDELCSYQLSDINLFSVCQIFQKNTYTGTTKGFLHSVPANDDHSLNYLLDQCLNCDKYENCTNRFSAANLILLAFENLLNISST